MASLHVPRSICQFSLALMKRILASAECNQNIVVSPFSIHLALSLALRGTADQTALEICHCLGLDDADLDSLRIANEYQELLEIFKNTLKIANKLYVSKLLHFKTTFNSIALEKFGSETQTVDFEESDIAAKIINEWVHTHTKQRIQHIVSPDEVGQLTAVLLVNAVYFRGSWKYPFNRGTRKQTFYNANRNTVDIDMMHLKEEIAIADLKDLNASAISLDYNESDLSMVIILPKKHNNLESLNHKLKKANLPEVFSRIHETQQVELTLPKFRAEFEINLKEVLMQMGMQTMFSSDKANFSESIEEDHVVYAEKVFHKTFIDVNETGTDAEAATVIEMVIVCVDDPCKFVANHPFRFFIRNTANVVLFDGCFRHAID